MGKAHMEKECEDSILVNIQNLIRVHDRQWWCGANYGKCSCDLAKAIRSIQVWLNEKLAK